MMTITDDQIEALENEAASVLDHVMVGICQIALTGEFERHRNLSLSDDERARLNHISKAAARRECARVITAAQADEEAARRERATQAGMAFGCAGYNDEMGY